MTDAPRASAATFWPVATGTPLWQARLPLARRAPQLHGPYWQWTRKVKGKTVTVTLSESQAAMLREWLENGRLYDRQLAELEQLSVQVTDRLLAAASSQPPRLSLVDPLSVCHDFTRPTCGKSDTMLRPIAVEF